MPKLTQSQLDSIAFPPHQRMQLADGGSLYLVAETRGRPAWRIKYRVNRSQRTVSLGRYPGVSLDAARAAAIIAWRQINAGVDPTAARRQERAKPAPAPIVHTFGKAGDEFLELRAKKEARRTSDKHKWLFGLLAPLHNRPLAGIKASEVLKVLRSLEAQGKTEAARRAGQFTARVYRFAIGLDYCENNPASDLRGNLEGHQTVSHAAILDPAEFGRMMQMIDARGYSHATVYNGLRLLARTALRPGELRQGLWSEIDFDKAEWRIPGARMKMKRDHLIPLSTQALEILRAQHEVSGDSLFIFPGVRSGRPMSDAGMGVSLKNMFIPATSHVPHGFRSSFSTLMNEAGVDPAVIELQLSHAKQNKIVGIYDRSQRIPERRQLMQKWADYIDELK